MHFLNLSLFITTKTSTIANFNEKKNYITSILCIVYPKLSIHFLSNLFFISGFTVF